MPHERRRSFYHRSRMPGIPLGNISCLIGHQTTTVT